MKRMLILHSKHRTGLSVKTYNAWPFPWFLLVYFPLPRIYQVHCLLYLYSSLKPSKVVPASLQEHRSWGIANVSHSTGIPVGLSWDSDLLATLSLCMFHAAALWFPLSRSSRASIYISLLVCANIYLHIPETPWQQRFWFIIYIPSLCFMQNWCSFSLGTVFFLCTHTVSHVCTHAYTFILTYGDLELS